MQMGIRHEKGSDQLRLSLPRIYSYMEETYRIHDKFLYLENKIFRNMDHTHLTAGSIHPENGKCDLIVIYEIQEPEQLFPEWTLFIY